MVRFQNTNPLYERLNYTTMALKKYLTLILIAGAILFNIIFWNEQLALNLFIFDLFIIGSLIYLYGMPTPGLQVYLLLANGISILNVLIFNSDLSKIASIISLLLVIAFTKYTHRSVWWAFRSLLTGIWLLPQHLEILIKSGKKSHQLLGWLKHLFYLTIIPLVVALIFLLIYDAANTVFAGNVQQFLTWAGQLLSRFSLERLLFTILGFGITAVLLLRAGQTSFEKKDAASMDNLIRNKKRVPGAAYTNVFVNQHSRMQKMISSVVGLKYEYKIGLICLSLLNLLLLLINLIDINYLWFHFTYTASTNLYSMIHEGTDLLILSILLAIVVLMRFFRGNLNFYKENIWLKRAAYVWLIQNTILVVSVFLRDYYYIREFGLAYKRIGVIFFLLLVLAGLLTVVLKIRFKKTSYYLFRLNAWLVFSVLTATTVIQWDIVIAKYNIAHMSTVPLNLNYLLSLSDKVLPVIQENLPALKEREKHLNAALLNENDRSLPLVVILAQRKSLYLHYQQSYSWLSWNFTDQWERTYFINHD
jgi:hypothetical protein